jgi:hypothetical protein
VSADSAAWSSWMSGLPETAALVGDGIGAFGELALSKVSLEGPGADVSKPRTTLRGSSETRSAELLARGGLAPGTSMPASLSRDAALPLDVERSDDLLRVIVGGS